MLPTQSRKLERCREILASADDGRGLAAVVARAEAVAAAARGSWKESEEQFVKAAETFRRLGMVWQEAQTFQTWSHALRAGADRRASIEKLDKAIEPRSDRRHGADQSWIESVKGGLAHSNGNGASGAHHDPAPVDAVFRREGDYWTISWRGNVVRLKDAKGLAHIAYLLANPGREFMACELAAAGTSHITSNGKGRVSIDAGRTVSDLGDAGAMLDAKAREQYRVRIGELREEMAEAAQHNDTLRAARLRSELESLREQIVAAVGLGGRNRKAASHRERARLMVTKAIKTALAKIRARDASLGRYLATSIKTGNRCSYDPGPTPAVYWQL